MTAPVDWEAAVARFYNAGEREWDQALGPSPKQPGCRVPAHILRAYGYKQVAEREVRSAQHSVSQKRPPTATQAASTALDEGPTWAPTVLAPPIKLSQMDAWKRQVIGDRNLPPSAVKVALSISLHLNRQTGLAWPSIKTIAKEIAMSHRTVYIALIALELGHHLARQSGGGKRSNRYRLLLWEPVKQGAPVNEISPVKAHFLHQ